MEFEEAMDHCILQKILPRITGSDSRVETLLEELYRLYTNKEYIDEIDRYFLICNEVYLNIGLYSLK